MNEKVKARIIVICLSVVLFGTGLLFGRGCSQKGIDDALRIAEQERIIADGFKLDLSTAAEYNKQLTEQLGSVRGSLDASLKDRAELERQNRELKTKLDYLAELDRQTRESLERLKKAIYVE